jgi:hypothetical protein
MALDVGDWLSQGAPSNGRPTGLFVVGKEDKSVPLKRREVAARLFCDAGFADTVERLHFVSDEDVSATFKFPLPPRAAVYRYARPGSRSLARKLPPAAACCGAAGCASPGPSPAPRLPPARAALCRFEARIGERTIRTQVKKRAEAQVEYDTATGQGHAAVLMKQEPGAPAGRPAGPQPA